MKSDTAVIANITEQSYMAHRTYGTFQIAGRGGRGSLRADAHHAAHGGDGLWRQAHAAAADTAREIADDLCREINSDAGERSFLGVFVCAGDAPTEEELRGAREKLDEFYRALVAAADREWERSHSFLFIHDLQRRAAARLGLEKEWYYQARETGECPGCGERVKPGVAVCKSCDAILDREKALALGLIQPRRRPMRRAQRHRRVAAGKPGRDSNLAFRTDGSSSDEHRMKHSYGAEAPRNDLSFALSVCLRFCRCDVFGFMMSIRSLHACVGAGAMESDSEVMATPRIG